MTVTKILYIGGQTRSGSTLVARLMGAMDGFVNAGELTYVWRPFLQNTLCGCGLPFDECPFWTKVIAHSFGDKSSLDANQFLHTKHEFERPKSVMRLVNPLKSAAQRTAIRQYAQFLQTLYASISVISADRVVIDSSKSPLYLAMLAKVSNIDLRVLHLVRDSRAVAYSWDRRRPNGCPELSPARLAMDWNVQNIATEIVGKRLGKSHYMRMRYEDFVEEPTRGVTAICEFMGEPVSALDFLKAPMLQIPVHHTVNGNPDRFKTEFFIRPDIEWIEKMDQMQKAQVSRVCGWLLKRYGYRV